MFELAQSAKQRAAVPTHNATATHIYTATSMLWTDAISVERQVSVTSGGLDIEEDTEDLVPEPLDVLAGDRKLVTQPYDFSVDQLASDVKKQKILLIEVPYQREYVWDDAKASRLIESLLLNVPVPVCYFAENEDGTWEVIDGLQRCQSIVRFLNGTLRLRGLSVLTELNGQKFNELTGRDQRRIETRTLRFVVITAESHPDIKFDVFERLNTGAVKLTPQELRNCIYRGTLNDELRKLIDDKGFRAAVGRSRDSRMRDEELVLRFIALAKDLPAYKPPLTQFLNEYMRVHRFDSCPPELIRAFRSSMKTVHTVFGDTGFRALREGAPTPNLNRAVFDAVALSFYYSNTRQVSARKSTVLEGHKALLEDTNFLPLIGRATADRTRMHGRVRRYAEMLESCGIRVSLPTLPDE